MIKQNTLNVPLWQEATLRGETDALATPASRIVMGRSVELGTGCLDLTQHLDSLGLGS